MSNPFGVPIIESRLVPEDQAWLIDRGNGKFLAVWNVRAFKLGLAAKDAIDLWRSLPFYRRWFWWAVSAW